MQEGRSEGVRSQTREVRLERERDNGGKHEGSGEGKERVGELDKTVGTNTNAFNPKRGTQ